MTVITAFNILIGPGASSDRGFNRHSAKTICDDCDDRNTSKCNRKCPWYSNISNEPPFYYD